MSLVFTSEQEELRRTVRAFLAETSSSSQVRRVMETPGAVDRDVWHRMATQLGLHGLAIPEEYGGAGFCPVEQVVVVEEAGRALLCAPFFGTVVLAATALMAADDPTAAKDLLPGIAEGQTVAALAVTEDDGSWNPDATTLRA